MLMRHGILTTEILDLIEADPSLGDPLPGGEDYLRAEIAYAASHEGALHLDDVLARRTRLSIETWDRAVGASRPAAEIVAPILGWDADTVDNEVEHYRQRVEAERTSQTMPDDEAADRARLSSAGHQRLTWSGRRRGAAGPSAVTLSPACAAPPRTDGLARVRCFARSRPISPFVPVDLSAPTDPG